jgi:hypothetical protein
VLLCGVVVIFGNKTALFYVLKLHNMIKDTFSQNDAFLCAKFVRFLSFPQQQQTQKQRNKTTSKQRFPTCHTRRLASARFW